MKISKVSKIFVIIVSINILNVIIDHFFAPAGIGLSLIFSIACAIFVIYNFPEINLFLKIIAIYLAVAINDLGIKLYGGGMHDSEGQGVINLVFITECIVITLITIFGLFQQKPKNIKIIILFLLFLLFLFFIHIEIFSLTGMGRYYPIYTN